MAIYNLGRIMIRNIICHMNMQVEQKKGNSQDQFRNNEKFKWNS